MEVCDSPEPEIKIWRKCTCARKIGDMSATGHVWY